MERIASIHAMLIVSNGRVTESTAVVCMVVKMGNNVMKVYILMILIYNQKYFFMIKKKIKHDLSFKFSKM